MNRLLEQAVGGEVFSEHSHRKFPAGQLSFPVVVMRDGIAVDGFVFSAVHGEVGLAVAIQIEFAQGDAAGERLLENSANNFSPVPDNFSGKSGVHGDEPHRSWM